MTFQEESDHNIAEILSLISQINEKLGIVQSEQNATNARLDSIEKKQEVHTKAIMNLENSVTHELKMLNENLPDALAKREAFEDIADKVDDHDNRIFALEQVVANQ